MTDAPDAMRSGRRKVHKLEIIVQNPNLEGVLLRLHSGQEQRTVAAREALDDDQLWRLFDVLGLRSPRGESC